MYYYEKDYIMRLIHGTAMVLARLLLGRQMEEEGEIVMGLSEDGRVTFHAGVKDPVGQDMAGVSPERLAGVYDFTVLEDCSATSSSMFQAPPVILPHKSPFVSFF